MTWIQLRHVYKAFVFSKLLYASPAWWGFTSAARPTSNVSRQHYDVLSGSIDRACLIILVGSRSYRQRRSLLTPVVVTVLDQH